MHDAVRLQGQMVALVRAFGLHQPDQTPCGQPVAVSEAHALMDLADAGPLAQTGLAERLRLDKSTVSRLVGHLEQRGWVSRQRHPTDGRSVLLRLTPEGTRVSNRLATARADKFARVFDQVPPEEQAAVLRALDVLVRAMTQDTRGGGRHGAADGENLAGVEHAVSGRLR